MTAEPNATLPEWLPRRLLTAQEVAEILQVSTRTVWRLIKQGHLKKVFLGRAVRIRPEAIIALIESK